MQTRDKKYSLQVLISTINRINLEFVNSIYKFNTSVPPTLVVNQFNKIEPENSPYHNLEIINSATKGLSCSRNEALKYADADIVVFTDDDVSFTENAFRTIQEYHVRYPGYDIIIFKAITNAQKPFRPYYSEIKELNVKECAFVCSIEMTAKLKSLQEKSLKFDERFGLGATFSSNEEWVFLSDALKKGLKVLFVPEYIVQHDELSSGTVYDKRKLQATGASLVKVYPIWGWFKLLIMIRHADKMNLRGISTIQFIKYLFQGAYSFSISAN